MLVSTSTNSKENIDTFKTHQTLKVPCGCSSSVSFPCGAMRCYLIVTFSVHTHFAFSGSENFEPRVEIISSSPQFHICVVSF